jgi:hypothetical protein
VLGTGVKFGTEDAILRFVAGWSNHNKKKAKGNRKARQQHLGSLAVSIVCQVGTRSLCFLFAGPPGRGLPEPIDFQNHRFRLK